MRFIAAHYRQSHSTRRVNPSDSQVLIEIKPGLQGDQLIEEVLRAVQKALVSGGRRLLIDCHSIVGANSAFTACILVIARRIYEHDAACELIGLNDNARFSLELHRVERALKVAGVRVRAIGSLADRSIEKS